MNYDFRSLSPIDFERLVRDLLQKALSLRLETFAPGPDQGIDLRYTSRFENVIVQAKHYVGSTFSTLQRDIQKEVHKIELIQPTQYILATSLPITPLRKNTLVTILSPYATPTDIIGPEDLNNLLGRYPSVEKRHFKLWLSSTTVLERIFHAQVMIQTQDAKDRFLRRVERFVANPGLTEAKRVLDREHVLIVSGPPGVGKTTLAEMISHIYAAQGWELIVIDELDQAYGVINDGKKQIFFFDDFLGQITLTPESLRRAEGRIMSFIERVHQSRNARFILTTREYILQQAKLHSERISSTLIDISRFILDVATYTRRLRALMLFNHLYFSKLSKRHVLALIDSGAYRIIVDHDNFSPRIIEHMTELTHLNGVPPSRYVSFFLETLANPQRLWEHAYKRHISKAAQNLVLSVFFCSDWMEIRRLRELYQSVHESICNQFSWLRSPSDFSDSMKELEGSFINISDGMVEFINPSISDYLDELYSDGLLLQYVLPKLTEVTEVLRAWEFIERRRRDMHLSDDVLYELLLGRIELLASAPVWARDEDGALTPVDLDFPARLGMLLDWAETFGPRQQIWDACGVIGHSITQGSGLWSSAATLAKLVQRMASSSFSAIPAKKVRDDLESSLQILLSRGSPSLEVLESVLNCVEASEDLFSEETSDILIEAISEEIASVETTIDQIESEAELDEYVSKLRSLAHRVSADATIAMDFIRQRRACISDGSAEDDDVTVPLSTGRGDRLSDKELDHIFQGLR